MSSLIVFFNHTVLIFGCLFRGTIFRVNVGNCKDRWDAYSKTALLRFGSYAKQQYVKLGEKRPPTFDFLGFSHYVTESRRKRFMVGRKTQGSRVCGKLKEVNIRLAKRCIQVEVVP